MPSYKDKVIVPSVKKGAELLDQVAPGWANAINVRLLNLATPNPNDHLRDGAQIGMGCILCQLDNYLYDGEMPNRPIILERFGDYVEGLQNLREAASCYIEGEEYGFDIMDEFWDDDDEDPWINPYSQGEYYAILDELWRKEIDSRTRSSV